jgi:hypothetical protein
LSSKTIAAIFPEKLIYDEKGYRIPRMNEGVELICLINSDLRKIKNETNSVKADLSRLVLLARPLTNFFIEDLRRISDLKIPK